MKSAVRTFALCLIILTPKLAAAQFNVGFAKRDVTPKASVPMWGYGMMGARKSTGTLDPLHAKGVVIETPSGKLAIIGLDIGRGPDAESFRIVSEAVKEKAGVETLLISGSHTHHGPCMELSDEVGKGKGKFDDAVAYVKEFEQNLIDLVVEAADKAVAAKIGWASADVPLCRNRHSKLPTKPIEDELTVVRFDDNAGKPIAHLVNFSAHPTIIDAFIRMFSAEWPGAMCHDVEQALGTNCFFMQGSAGDLSPNTTELTSAIAAEMKAEHAKMKAAGQEVDPAFQHEVMYTVHAFGQQMATEVLALDKQITTASPATPSIQSKYDHFEFETRLKISNDVVRRRFAMAFFPELVNNFADELEGDKIRPIATTALINGELALVGGSGEYFSDHSNRLKQRSRAKKTLFFGYCNDHHMYFPTIEGAAEGGYGADPTVSWVELGAGEQMMDQALINLYTFMGDYEWEMEGGPIN